MPKELPSPELLRKLLRYEPETGKLFWLPRHRDYFSTQRSCSLFNATFANRITNQSPNSAGYLTVKLFGKSHQSHRLCYAVYYGEWPNGWIDHINGDRTDNRILNIRVATPTQNARNISIGKNNTSGVCGVSFHSRDKKWQAHIRANGKQITIGNFHCLWKAVLARRKAEREHGYSIRVNR